jgi:hypothetical protein
METRSNFGSQKFGTTKIRNDNEDSYASINLPLTLSSPSARADTLEVTCDDFLKGTYCLLSLVGTLIARYPFAVAAARSPS